MIFDVAIAGGGIGGAALANLLGRKGKRVVVFERGTLPASLIRPEILWPKTIEILRELIPGTLEDQWRLQVKGFRFYQRGRRLAEATDAAFRKAGFGFNSTDPARTRELLLNGGSFEVRRGVEVVSVLKDHGRVSGLRVRSVPDGRTEEVPARLTVGDDGVRSVVRSGCGIEVELRPIGIELLAFEIPWPSSLEESTLNVGINDAWKSSGIVALGLIPQPGFKGVGVIPVRSRALKDEAGLRDALRSFCTREPRVGEFVQTRAFPGDLKRFRIGWGHAPKYGIDGAVLMGDAAHPVTPAGGQGANLSVADAVTLADLLLHGNPADLLAEYERRRRPANKRSIALSRILEQAIKMPDRLFDALVPSGFRWVGRHAGVFSRVLRHFAGAFAEETKE